MLLEGVAKHHFLVPLSEQVEAELWAVVKKTPLKMALKCRLRAGITSRELNPEDASSRLQPGLLPEEGHEAADLDKRHNVVVDVDGLLCLCEVGHMSFIVHTSHIEPVVYHAITHSSILKSTLRNN